MQRGKRERQSYLRTAFDDGRHSKLGCACWLLICATAQLIIHTRYELSAEAVRAQASAATLLLESLHREACEMHDLTLSTLAVKPCRLMTELPSPI